MIELSNKAKQDIKDISRYTREEWGIPQQKAYLKQLDSTFEHIQQLPAISQNCDHIKPNYKRVALGKHYIYYRYHKDSIYIVRILHERMDLREHL